MAKGSRGFFERLTGARLVSDDEELEKEADVPFSNDPEAELAEAAPADSDDGEEYLDEAIEEDDDEPEQDFSDTPSGSADEQEGQLTVDVFQDDANIIIQSTIAGVTPEDLDVSITNDMVTIRGERRRTFEADPEDYFYQECYWGIFSRSIILPIEIDSDRAEAKIKNGVLTIRIPKANTAMTRKLTIKSS